MIKRRGLWKYNIMWKYEYMFLGYETRTTVPCQAVNKCNQQISSFAPHVLLLGRPPFRVYMYYTEGAVKSACSLRTANYNCFSRQHNNAGYDAFCKSVEDRPTYSKSCFTPRGQKYKTVHIKFLQKETVDHGTSLQSCRVQLESQIKFASTTTFVYVLICYHWNATSALEYIQSCSSRFWSSLRKL